MAKELNIRTDIEWPTEGARELSNPCLAKGSGYCRDNNSSMEVLRTFLQDLEVNDGGS